jgi:hypothetical protein
MDGIPPSRVASLVNINLLIRKNKTTAGAPQIPQDSAPQDITRNDPWASCGLHGKVMW